MIFKSSVKRVAVFATGILMATSSLIGVASEAHAVSCLTQAKYTSTAPGSSTDWAITGTSSCNDLNAAYAHTKADKVKGWYKQSGVWREGTRGFVAVPKTDGSWKVLLSDIKNGSTVRGETYSYNQYVQYVW